MGLTSLQAPGKRLWTKATPDSLGASREEPAQNKALGCFVGGGSGVQGHWMEQGAGGSLVPTMG